MSCGGSAAKGSLDGLAAGQNRGRGLANGKPGSTEPYHRLLEQERAAVLAAAGQEAYVDFPRRTLAVTAWDEGLFFVSFSLVYRIMASGSLIIMWGLYGPHNGQSAVPERRGITIANQR